MGMNALLQMAESIPALQTVTVVVSRFCTFFYNIWLVPFKINTDLYF